MNEEHFGLETLFQAFKSSIKKKGDVIILLVHWYLTFKKNFQLTGIGEPLEPPPENHILNENWNESAVNYLMHYSIRDLSFTLAACLSEDSLIMNLINFEKNLISQMILEIKYAVKNFESEDIISCIENPEFIVRRINVELVDPVYKIPLNDRTTQTHQEQRLLQIFRKKTTRAGPLVCQNILHLVNAECSVPHPNREKTEIFKKCRSQSMTMGGRAFSREKSQRSQRSQNANKNEENIDHFHFLMYS